MTDSCRQDIDSLLTQGSRSHGIARVLYGAYFPIDSSGALRDSMLGLTLGLSVERGFLHTAIRFTFCAG